MSSVGRARHLPTHSSRARVGAGNALRSAWVRAVAGVAALSSKRNAGPRAGQSLVQAVEHEPLWGPARATSWAYAMLLLAFWMVTRPYAGIVHDARLYAIQAMRYSNPSVFSDDLYFRFGSQDSFTLFSSVYAPIVSAFGPSIAHIAATLLAHSFWIGALLVAVSALFPSRRQAWFAAIGVVLLSPAYGSQRIFGYGEPFATPRIVAEAIVLLSIAALLRDRKVLCIALLGVAFAIHPLMALPGAAVAMVILVRDAKKLIALGAASAMALGLLAGQGIEPFVRLSASFDAQWFGVVAERLSFALVSHWDAASYCGLVLPIVSVVLFRHRATPAGRTVLDAVLLVAALGVSASWIGADIFRNVLVLNLQVWRTLWLLMLVGNAVAVPALLQLPDGSAAKPLLLLSVLLTIAEAWMRFPAFASGGVALLAAFAVAFERRAPAGMPRQLRAAGALIVCAAIALDLGALWFFVVEITGQEYARRNAADVSLIVGGILVLLSASRVPVLMQCALGTMLLSMAAMSVDRRSEWTRFVESQESSHELDAFVAGAGSVYWEAGLEILWLKMGRSSYYSCTQGTGAMFFRKTAMEYQRRGVVLAALNTDDFADTDGVLCARRSNPMRSSPPDRSVLETACRRLDDLGALILTTPVSGVNATRWRSRTPVLTHANGRAVARQDFYLFRCADFREAAP